MKIQKLVRDKIPHKIEQNGEVAMTRILDNTEYETELLKKLQEEVAEFSWDKNIEEMADIREVLHAIEKHFGFDPSEVEQVRIQKREKNGGFEDKIYLEETQAKTL